METKDENVSVVGYFVTDLWVMYELNLQSPEINVEMQSKLSI